MQNDIKRILFSQDRIQEKVQKLGADISREYKGKDLLLVGLLNGAYMFLSDLAKHITIPVQIDFIGISSYEGTESKSVKVTRDLKNDPKNKHILIIEDLIDSGNTLDWLVTYFESKKCLSVNLCILVNKITDRRCKDPDIKYTGFMCEDVWIVGYGMDYNEYYRNLPYVGELKKEIYE